MGNSYCCVSLFVGYIYFKYSCHFSYAPLIKYIIIRIRNMIFVFCDYQRKAHQYCISHWNFIVIRSETNEKMNLEGHYL